MLTGAWMRESDASKTNSDNAGTELKRARIEGYCMDGGQQPSQKQEQEGDRETDFCLECTQILLSMQTDSVCKARRFYFQCSPILLSICTDYIFSDRRLYFHCATILFPSLFDRNSSIFNLSRSVPSQFRDQTRSTCAPRNSVLEDAKQKLDFIEDPASLKHSPVRIRNHFFLETFRFLLNFRLSNPFKFGLLNASF
jgi:hypothetical protein